MHESSVCFHNIEWPPAGARLAGPVAWLRGWIVGKPGYDFTDVRVRHDGGTHLGVLGLPRTDLAAHFGSARSWLPAEFTLGVPVSSNGPAELILEAMDAAGRWHDLQHLPVTIAYDGQPPPRVDGRIEPRPDGSWTVRDAHHPFHGHLDAPGSTPTLRDGRLPVFGWLLDETRPLAAVLATADALVFNHLEHSRTDAALATRIAHPRAGTARLRGAVDFPATASVPACLRVYAVSPDNTVTLCFAGRVQPTEAAGSSTPAPALVAPPEQALPSLPSGRPRRLLFVLRSLFPSDAALRALDVVRHLVASHRWAARIITTEDGPLRRDFEAAGAESLVLDPGALLAAASADAMQDALHALARRLRFDHLDAVIVNDAVCGWAMALARRRNIPVLFDCSAPEPIAPDATALPEVQALQREGWQSANLVCFASTTAASAQDAAFAGRPSALVGQWHTPGLLPAVAGTKSRVVLAPLRTADWLARRHPAEAARWIFRQGPATRFDDELLALQDDALGPAALQRAPDWGVTEAALCLGPLFGRGPLRPVIDAAAAGIPVVAPRLPLTAELFAGTRIPLVDSANPLALTHAFLAWAALPGSYQREADAVAPDFRAAHDPAQLLPRWERLLETVIAAARNVT